MRLLCAPWPNTHLKSTASDKEGPHQNNLDPKTCAWAQVWKESLSSSLPEKKYNSFRSLSATRSVWVRHLNLRHCHEQHWEESHQGIAIKQNKAIVISFWPGTNNPSSITTVLVLLTSAPMQLWGLHLLCYTYCSCYSFSYCHRTATATIWFGSCISTKQENKHRSSQMSVHELKTLSVVSPTSIPPHLKRWNRNR